MTLTPLPYTPSNWYWIVAGSTSQVYSSAAVAYVPVADSTYTAWLMSGGVATKIAVEQDLWDVLVAAGVAIPATATESDTSKAARINRMDLVVFKVLFNHENRIRTLAGQATITAAQFAAGIKAIL